MEYLSAQLTRGLEEGEDRGPVGCGKGEMRLAENRAAYLQTVTIAESARRRAAQAGEAAARRSRPGRRSGDFPDAELSMELLITQADAAGRLNAAAARADEILAAPSPSPSCRRTHRTRRPLLPRPAPAPRLTPAATAPFPAAINLTVPVGTVRRTRTPRRTWKPRRPATVPIPRRQRSSTTSSVG